MSDMWTIAGETAADRCKQLISSILTLFETIPDHRSMVQFNDLIRQVMRLSRQRPVIGDGRVSREPAATIRHRTQLQQAILSDVMCCKIQFVFSG